MSQATTAIMPSSNNLRGNVPAVEGSKYPFCRRLLCFRHSTPCIAYYLGTEFLHARFDGKFSRSFETAMLVYSTTGDGDGNQQKLRHY
jgi:hypothetical protein